MSKEIFKEDICGNGVINHISKEDLSKNEYFFSTTRKGQNHFGVVLRIINDRLLTKLEKKNIKYEDNNMSISINQFNGENVDNFIEHIKIIGIYENYFMQNPTSWDLKDWRLYVYSGIEISIFTTCFSDTGKIGNFVTEECANVLKEQFFTMKYFGHSYFALFCAIEGITKIDNFYKYISLRKISFFIDKQTPYIELNFFSKGIEVQDFFSDYSFKIIDEKDNLLLIDAFYYQHKEKDIEIDGISLYRTEYFSDDEISQARLLKISNFKNANIDWWILFKVDESETILTTESAVEYLHTNFNIVP